MAASHSWSSRPNAPALHGRPPIPASQLQTTFYHPGQRAYPVQRAHVHIGPRVPGDELSTQLGKEVESKFGFIFRQLGLLVQANKTMLRTNGCWKFAPEYEVFCEQRRIIAAALREYPEAPEQLLGQHAADIDDALGVGGQFRETLLESARRARSMNQDAARAVQTCRPPVPLGSVLLEIDLVIGPHSAGTRRFFWFGYSCSCHDTDWSANPYRRKLVNHCQKLPERSLRGSLIPKLGAAW